MVDQEWLRFLRLRAPDGSGTWPALAIATGDAPDSMPPLPDDTDWSTPIVAPGWTVIARLTMLLVSAPDDEAGFQTPLADGDRVDAVSDWLDLVDERGGTWLLFVPGEQFDTVSDGDERVDAAGPVHGGFAASR